MSKLFKTLYLSLIFTNLSNATEVESSGAKISNDIRKHLETGVGFNPYEIKTSIENKQTTLAETLIRFAIELCLQSLNADKEKQAEALNNGNSIFSSLIRLFASKIEAKTPKQPIIKSVKPRLLNEYEKALLEATEQDPEHTRHIKKSYEVTEIIKNEFITDPEILFKAFINCAKPDPMLQDDPLSKVAGMDILDAKKESNPIISDDLLFDFYNKSKKYLEKNLIAHYVKEKRPDLSDRFGLNKENDYTKNEALNKQVEEQSLLAVQILFTNGNISKIIPKNFKESKEEFEKIQEGLIRHFKEMLNKSETEETKIYYTTAIDGIKMLRGDAGLPTFHNNTPPSAYLINESKIYSNHRKLTGIELFIILYKMCKKKVMSKEDVFCNLIAEKYGKNAEWNYIKQVLTANYEIKLESSLENTIQCHKDFLHELFLAYLDDEKLTWAKKEKPNLLGLNKFRSNHEKMLEDAFKGNGDPFLPLAEVLYMLMRGHVSTLLSLSQKNIYSPTCKEGFLSRLIEEIARIENPDLQLRLEIKDCASK